MSKYASFKYGADVYGLGLRGEFRSALQRTDGSFLVDMVAALAFDRFTALYNKVKYAQARYAASSPVGSGLYGSGLLFGTGKLYGYDPEGHPSQLTSAEYTINAGASWNTATPQELDYRHTMDSPSFSIPSWFKEFGFVWDAFRDLAEGEFTVQLRLVIEGTPSVTVTSTPFAVTTVVVDPTATTATVSAGRRRAMRVDDFLGEGPIAPWRRGAQDFMTARGKELVASALRQILNTRAATIRWGGEIEWDPGFGNLLWTLKHSPGDEITDELAAGFVELALEQEPRVLLSSVGVEYRIISNRRAMFVYVKWKLISSNIPENEVLLPEFEETVEVL